MGFWAQLCTYVLSLLESPLSSVPSPFTEHNDLAGVYAPEIFNPTTPNTQRVDNAYDSIFTTEDSCNGPYTRQKWCYKKNIYTDYEIETPNTGKTNYVSSYLALTDHDCNMSPSMGSWYTHVLTARA